MNFIAFFLCIISIKSCELSRHIGRQACQGADGKREKMEISLTVAHLHKCIIGLSDHVHTRRLGMLVRLAVHTSGLPLIVASFTLHRGQDAMNDSTFATMFTEFCPKLQRLSSPVSQYSSLTFEMRALSASKDTKLPPRYTERETFCRI